MPHLDGAMKLTGVGMTGLCIHRSAAFVLDMPGSVLCFGTFRAATPEEIARDPRSSREPFIHCWAEYQGAVYAPTTIEAAGGLRAIDPALYYQVNGATNIKRLSRPDLLKIAREIGLSAHLRRGKPARVSVGGALLDAVGIEYRIGLEGGLVPA